LLLFDWHPEIGVYLPHRVHDRGDRDSSIVSGRCRSRKRNSSRIILLGNIAILGGLLLVLGNL